MPQPQTLTATATVLPSPGNPDGTEDIPANNAKTDGVDFPTIVIASPEVMNYIC